MWLPVLLPGAPLLGVLVMANRGRCCLAAEFLEIACKAIGILHAHTLVGMVRNQIWTSPSEITRRQHGIG